MAYSVYWIRHKDHTNIFNDGYVGVSNNFERRMAEHNKCTNEYLKNAIKKYGWDNLVKSVILYANENYCLEFEKKLRSSEKTGWNLCIGGGMPPSMIGRKRPNHALKLLGRKRPDHSKAMQGGNNPRAISVKFDGITFSTILDLAKYLNKSYGTIYNRIMQNPQKYGYEVLK